MSTSYETDKSIQRTNFKYFCRGGKTLNKNSLIPRVQKLFLIFSNTLRVRHRLNLWTLSSTLYAETEYLLLPISHIFLNQKHASQLIYYCSSSVANQKNVHEKIIAKERLFSRLFKVLTRTIGVRWCRAIIITG